MPELKEVIISITNRCNARCRMCDIYDQRTEELATSSWEKVIRDALALEVETIVFSGGEPLLREDILELISFVKNNRMKVCITSNGYFLNEEMASKLTQVGVDVVNISVEGPPGIHDYLRGADSLNRAVSALENLKKYNIESTIATVVSNYNYRYLMYIVELAKKYGATTIKFQPFSEIFLSNGNRIEEFMIPAAAKEELSSAVNKAANLCSEYGITTNPRGYLERIPVYLTHKKYRSHNFCAAILTSCPIDAAGTVYPCWFITDRDNQIGNIKENSLLSMWSSKRRASIIEKIKKNGCPGCMMSCYDENFGKESVELRIAVNVNRIRKKGLYEYSKRLLKKLVKRIKFYMAYRGSPKIFIGRLKKLAINKKSLPQGLIDQKEIRRALEEINETKRIFEREVKNLK